jgi:hypothetical protein
MKRMALLALVGACLAGAAPKTLIEWTFDQAADATGWAPANHLSDLRVENGALTGRLMDWDPWVTSPQFEIKATPWQRIEFRLKTDCGGSGQIFFTNTTETKYGGFTPGKNVNWQVNGDGQWHTYTIYPFWGAEKKIIMIRLDLARAEGAQKGKATFALDWLRIVGLDEPPKRSKPPVWTFPGSQELKPANSLSAKPGPNGLVLAAGDNDAWLESPYMSFPADEGLWAVVRLATTAGDAATLTWISSETSNRQQKGFEVIPDGKMRTYNVDLSGQKTWADDIYFVGLRPPVGKGTTTLAEIAIQDEPGGPALPVIRYAGLQDAINRVGRPATFLITLENRGGQPLKNATISTLSLPRGVQVAGPKNWRSLPELDTFDRREHRLELTADRPLKGRFSLTVTGSGDPVTYEDDLEFLPALNLPKASYVPEPRPVESDYDIGALYFPGWPSIDRWANIWATDPQRKPVLGWYDEANPEVVDWQIKWAVENGIKFFMVDWYWNKGSMHLEHWIRAYEKARYRKYLKWCMMYANHNGKGSHSEADQRAVTKYWIDNFFGMPEYYRINDMPVVMYWSPAGLKRDMGGETGDAKKLLDISRQMAREAGYKGIYFIAMKWPEASTNPKDIQWLKDEGFDMTSLYHFMSPGGKAKNPRRYPYKLVADYSYTWWHERLDADILPFLPNLSTGWHSRPWHGERGTWILDKNVPDFRRICQDAKKFADETGIKRMVMAPLNEWGEGSYAEPNKEFGFGMYEAVRDTFCKKPATGWPQNYAPADVGLGPYDLPMPKRKDRTAWDFADGSQGWNRMMGIKEFAAKDGVLRLVASSSDPALTLPLGKIRAKNYRQVAMRIRITPPPEVGTSDSAQLFWSTTTAGVSEATSVKTEINGDGQYHDCVFDVAANPRWRGRLTSFRLDPCSRANVTVEIAEIRLVK